MNNVETVISDKHVSVCLSADVREVCKPLFEKTDINTLIFGRFFKDGSCYMLTSNEKWHQYHFEKQYMPTAPIPEDIIAKRFSYILPVEGRYHQATDDAVNLFNIANPIDIIDMHDGFYDMYCFGSDKHSTSAVNFYLNHMDVLENFIAYFNEKAVKLIEKVANQKVMLPKKMRPQLLDACGRATERQILSFPIQKYAIEIDGQHHHLSRQEARVLLHLSQGKTAKETGKILDLSNRTVESYFRNIKSKLGCDHKSQVLDLFLASKLKQQVV